MSEQVTFIALASYRGDKAAHRQFARALDGRRFAIVESVFGHLRHNKQFNHFTLSGCSKVNVKWKWFCLVQYIEKVAHHGYAQQA
jgi:hypothetical protein